MTDKSINTKNKHFYHSDTPLESSKGLNTKSMRIERIHADEIIQDKSIAIQLINASLSIENIGYSDRTLANRLLKNKSSKHASKTKILKDLNVTIKKGEKVGLIGHNGAGKSSFLRLISGIYMPTEGKILRSVGVYPLIAKSPITSIELSGLDAIKAHYLIHNKSEKGLEEFAKNVIEFSGLEDSIDKPIKTYSEGMQARLMFSILTEERHECLALDEGIGTGDNRFHKKAEERLSSFLKNTGTLFLASHSEALIRMFCERGLVFQGGKIVKDGTIEDCYDYYNN